MRCFALRPADRRTSPSAIRKRSIRSRSFASFFLNVKPTPSTNSRFSGMSLVSTHSPAAKASSTASESPSISRGSTNSIAFVSSSSSLRCAVNTCGTSLPTPREEQVVALVAEGLSNREVALELGLSEHTIKKYLFRIFDKLGISTRVEFVLYAVAHGNQRVAEWLPAVSE